jgi:hypothetical protein
MGHKQQIRDPPKSESFRDGQTLPGRRGGGGISQIRRCYSIRFASISPDMSGGNGILC